MYKLEGKDIVISGFEEGIADSPYQGTADIRNVNIVSEPGEAAVNFKTSALTLPFAIAAAAFTAVASTDVFTWTATGVMYPGMAIILNTTSATGTVTGKVYYVGTISGNTFKLYPNSYYAAGQISPVNVTVDGSGTFTSYTMGKPLHSCVDQGQAFSTISNGVPGVNSYIVDTKNQVWMLIPFVGFNTYQAGTAIFLGNIGSSVVGGDTSICVWSNYLFVFRSAATDYWTMNLQDDPVNTWHYSWLGLSPQSGNHSKRCIVGQDDAIYLCNLTWIASILEVAGKTFAPTDATTYTTNAFALTLPEGEQATCLAELGTNLLVGGIRTYVYPWDRVSTSYSYPIVVPERYVSLIVSTNSNAYIFAGNRGRIYLTNGANIDLYKKIPDYVSGSMQPYYITGGVGNVNATTSNATATQGTAIYWRGQLYFTMVAYSNDNSLLTTIVGVWAINIDTNALRMVAKMSYATYAGQISVLIPDMASFRPGGEGLYCGWIDGSGNPGVDNSVSTPYDNYETVIDTEMIPVGTFLDPFSPSQVEWKTSAKLVSGEAVRLSYRTNLTDNFAQITDATHTTGESNEVGSISDMIQANFQKAQWVQLRAETKSTASSPSYTRVTELRIRDWPSGKNA